MAAAEWRLHDFYASSWSERLAQRLFPLVSTCRRFVFNHSNFVLREAAPDEETSPFLADLIALHPEATLVVVEDYCSLARAHGILVGLSLAVAEDAASGGRPAAPSLIYFQEVLAGPRLAVGLGPDDVKIKFIGDFRRMATPIHHLSLLLRDTGDIRSVARALLGDSWTRGHCSTAEPTATAHFLQSSVRVSDLPAGLWSGRSNWYGSLSQPSALGSVRLSVSLPSASDLSAVVLDQTSVAPTGANICWTVSATRAQERESALLAQGLITRSVLIVCGLISACPPTLPKRQPLGVWLEILGGCDLAPETPADEENAASIDLDYADALLKEEAPTEAQTEDAENEFERAFFEAYPEAAACCERSAVADARFRLLGPSGRALTDSWVGSVINYLIGRKSSIYLRWLRITRELRKLWEGGSPVLGGRTRLPADMSVGPEEPEFLQHIFCLDRIGLVAKIDAESRSRIPPIETPLTRQLFKERPFDSKLAGESSLHWLESLTPEVLATELCKVLGMALVLSPAVPDWRAAAAKKRQCDALILAAASGDVHSIALLEFELLYMSSMSRIGWTPRNCLLRCGGDSSSTWALSDAEADARATLLQLFSSVPHPTGVEVDTPTLHARYAEATLSLCYHEPATFGQETEEEEEEEEDGKKFSVTPMVFSTTEPRLYG